MGETQTAIIMVTDLVGSTATRSDVGEDVADDLRRRHDALLHETIGRHDGVLVKSLGDGVLARFSGAANAVECACEIQQRVAGRFDVRIGLSAGDVSLEDEDCFGTPVIEASRLCDRAEGGQILVADIVLALTRGRGGHVSEPMGALRVKGLAAPVPTSRVMWDRGHHTSVRFPDRLRPDGMSFVGRDDDLEKLIGAWRAVVGGSSRVVLISGEPGIGKTRLVSELALLAHDDGGIVLHGTAQDGSAQGIFTQALTPLVAGLPSDALEGHVEQYGGALAEHVPLLASRSTGSEPSETRGEGRPAVADALADLVRRATEFAPIMLILEDIHRIDDETALLFKSLASRSDLGAVFVVATYRHTALAEDASVRAVVRNLRATGGVDHVRLEGLRLTDVIELLATTEQFESERRQRDRAAEVHQETDGNPFLIGNALRRRTGAGAIFRLDRASRIELAAVATASLLGAAAIVWFVFFGARSGSALDRFLSATLAALLASLGVWFLLQANAKVTIGPTALALRTTGGLRVITVKWDDIDAIAWRPPRRWVGGSGAFFLETVDGRSLSNPVVKDPTPQLVGALSDACQRHHVNDVALRARFAKSQRRGR